MTRKQKQPKIVYKSKTVFISYCSGGVFTTVSVHLNGLKAEHAFRVWVAIIGHTLKFQKYSILYTKDLYKCHSYLRYARLEHIGKISYIWGNVRGLQIHIFKRH